MRILSLPFCSTFVALLLGFLFLPLTTWAAELYFSAPTVVTTDSTFSVQVLVNSAEESFNATDATIVFPNDVLEVVSVDISSGASIFNFWLYEPLFSNKEGEVSFAGGTTRGVLGEDVPILAIQFRVKGSGEALVTASDASINASDGSGTNILDNITASRITVVPAPLVVPERVYPGTLSTVQPTEPAPAPISVPETEGVAEVSSDREESSELEAETGLDTDETECELDVFSQCSLRFPTITDVEVVEHDGDSVNILVSGIAPEGDQVHVRLTQYGVHYEEVIAVVDEGGLWEARLSDIATHATYQLDAWASSADGARMSEVHSYTEDLPVFPSYMYEMYGLWLHWYEWSAIALAVVVIVLTGLIAWQIRREGNKWVLRGLDVLLVLAMGGFLYMLISAYLWEGQVNKIEVSYWNDSRIPCLPHRHAAVDDHGSAQIKVYVDDEEQLVPSGIGISPDCTADLHTHDNTGRLHLHLHKEGYRATLKDFFTLIDASLYAEGFDVSVTINGMDYGAGAEQYELHNGDEIVIEYTTAAEATMDEETIESDSE